MLPPINLTMDLIAAVRDKKRADAKALVTSGVNINATDETGNNALTWAVITKNYELLVLILQKAALSNPDIHQINTAIDKKSNENGYSSLLWACRKNNTKSVAVLLDYGPDVNTHGKDGTFPLYWAIKNNNTEMAKLLLGRPNGADPNPARATGHEENQDEPRHIWEIVIRNDRHEMAEILLDHGTSPDTAFTTKEKDKVSKKTSKTEWTPLQLACRRNRTNLALLLAERTSRDMLQVENVEGNTPLGSAVLHKNTELVTGLMRLGADPLHASKDHENCPFLKACQLGDEYLVIVATILRLKPSICKSEVLDEAILRLLRPKIQPGIRTRVEDTRKRNDPRCPKMVDLLLNHGGNVHELFIKSRVSEGPFSFSTYNINATQLILLVRAGLDDSRALERLVEASMKTVTPWVMDVVVSACPYAPKRSDWPYMFSAMQADADQPTDNINGETDNTNFLTARKQFLEALYRIAGEPPSLTHISARAVRFTLSNGNREGNVLATLHHCPEFTRRIPKQVTSLLTLESIILPEFLADSDGAIGRKTEASGHCSYVQVPKELQQCFSSVVRTADVPKWGLESKEDYNYVQSLFSSGLNENIINAPLLTCFLTINKLCPRPFREFELKSYGPHTADLLHNLLRSDPIKCKHPCPVEAKLTKITTTFLSILLFKLKEKHNLDFSLLPCGSVHAGNNIGPLDEMDYVLRWNISGEVKISKDIKDKSRRLFATFPSPCNALSGGVKELLYRFIRDQIEQWRDTLVVCGLVIEACHMYNQAPAVCFRMSWTCKDGHDHVISVDLTPCLIFKSHKLSSFSSRKGPSRDTNAYSDILATMLEAPLSLVLAEEQFSEIGNLFTSSWQVSTNVCDWRLFQMLDKVSPNIRQVYKMLKLFRDREFPKMFKFVEPNKTFENRWKQSQLVSSHVLKNVMLEEVEMHPVGESWGLSYLSERVISCLQRVIQNQLFKEAILGELTPIIQPRGLDQVGMTHLRKCLAEDASFAIGLLEKDYSPSGKLPANFSPDIGCSGDDILVIGLPKINTEDVSFLPLTLNKLRYNFKDIPKELASKQTATGEIYFYGPLSRRIIQPSDA